MAQALSHPTVLLDGSPTLVEKRPGYALWSDERTELLKKLWPRMSATQISEVFGISRNAIIGKVWRLKLKAVNKTATVERKPRPKPAWVPKQKTGPKPPQPTADLDIPPADFLALSFDQLRPGICRYPRGDGPFFYCGQPAEFGSSFCSYCYGLSHQQQNRNHHRNTGYYLNSMKGWL